MTAFVTPDRIRSLFAQAMSDMYRTEVPLYGDLVAEAVFAEGQAWDLFVDTLVQRGRARIQVDARVLLPEGGLATTLSGRYVAIAKR